MLDAYRCNMDLIGVTPFFTINKYSVAMDSACARLDYESRALVTIII